MIRQMSEARRVEAHVNHLTEHVAWCAAKELPVSAARSAAVLADEQARLAKLKGSA